jgi:hypothetical protein
MIRRWDPRWQLVLVVLGLSQPMWGIPINAFLYAMGWI